MTEKSPTPKKCKCNSPIVMIDLNSAKSKCPLCGLEKETHKGTRANNFLKMAKIMKRMNKKKGVSK